MLKHYIFNYEAHCGEILGIGHPAGGEDAFELTLRQEDSPVPPGKTAEHKASEHTPPAPKEGEVPPPAPLPTVIVPRFLENSQHLVVGSYYCIPLVDGEERDPPMILPAGLFVKLSTGPAHASHDKAKQGSHREPGR